LLNRINEEILKGDFKVKKVEITVESYYPEDMSIYYETLAEASAKALIESLTEDEIAAILAE
jgi:hypothetical protein